MSRIPLILLGGVLSSLDVPLLQLRPDVGYLRPSVMYMVAGLRAIGVEEGHQVLLCMPEVMEYVSQGCGWLVDPSVGLLETAGDRGRAHSCE